MKTLDLLAKPAITFLIHTANLIPMSINYVPLCKNGFRVCLRIVGFFSPICFTVCALGYTIYMSIQAGDRGR